MSDGLLMCRTTARRKSAMMSLATAHQEMMTEATAYSSVGILAFPKHMAVILCAGLRLRMF
eukprot:588396-Amphidinium_carterae.1